MELFVGYTHHYTTQFFKSFSFRIWVIFLWSFEIFTMEGSLFQSLCQKNFFSTRLEFWQKLIGAIASATPMCMVWHQIGDSPFLLCQCHIIAYYAPHNEDITMCNVNIFIQWKCINVHGKCTMLCKYLWGGRSDLSHGSNHPSCQWKDLYNLL